MSGKELEKITEPGEQKKNGGDENISTKMVGGGAFSDIKRKITNKDLTNPAVGRLLLDERDRLLSEKAVLESFRDNYYNADKRACVCEESNKQEPRFMILYTASITLGGIIIGASFILKDLAFYIILFVGILVVIFSIISLIFPYFKKSK